LTVATWLGVSGLLAPYVSSRGASDDTYGPLTAIIALVLWANLTGIVLLAGGRLTAQVEAVRAGTDPLLADSDDDGTPDEWAGARPR
jgi:uncharacterized BrkB/YihY/UPF0761 family membrane protein